MRGFLGLIFLGGVFCAYWVAAAQFLRVAPGHLPAQGAQVQSVAVAGFPLRFDLTLDRPALPARGWSGESLHLSLPSYWPFSATGTLSGPQDLTWRGAVWRIDGPDMPLTVALSPGLVLKSGTLTGRNLDLRGPVFGRLKSLAISLAPAENPQARTLRLELDGLSLGKVEIPSAGLRAVLQMNAAPRLTRHPQVQQIDLEQARITMDEIQAKISGMLDRGPDGGWTGTLTATVTKWPKLLGMLQQNDLLPPDQARMLLMMAQGMAVGDTLSLPLRVAQSVLYLGPLPLLDLGRL